MPKFQEQAPSNLLRPILLLSYSAFYVIPTIWHLLVTFQWRTFLSPDDFKDAWFARFWAFFGPRSRMVAEPVVVPLIQDSASGICLDIGPGSGQWLDLFARSKNPSITKIYGVEPNRDLHPLLRASAVKAGLGDVYEIVGAGAEELGAKGILGKGSVDTIITVQCLCSVPGPERIVKDLYPLLKPGGKWLVYEHVRTKYSGDFVAYWQQIINLVWPHFFNGCDICRPTDEWLLQAGPWEEVNLRAGEGEGKFDTVPHIIGTLTKQR
ncbi:hypothetical protein MBLNU230_g0135t1 [Neophaeotheca triangularis]